jgi:nucleoid-associated protein Lsr2
MAQRTIIELIDDLDQKPVKQGDGETVTFGLEGVEYEIDLSKANAAKLRKAMEPYIDVARHVGGGTKRGGKRKADGRRSRDYDPKAVRAWAESHRVEVPARGRIPASVVEQYHAAGN